MSDRSPSRTRILVAAQALILSKGFPATTIDEVCEAAEVTKGGFYYHFKSKDELALALVEHYFDGLTQALGGGEHTKLRDPVERVFAFVDHALDVVHGPVLRDGCVLGVLTLDLSTTHPEVRRAIAERFAALTAVLEGDLAAAVAEGRGRAGLDVKALARQFFAVLEGSVVLSKAYDEPELMAEGLRHYRMFLEEVFSSQG